MRLLTILKISLILIMPAIIFLLVLNISGFDKAFYEERFRAYHQGNISSSAINEKVLGFLKGKNNELPDEFTKREAEHLRDVRDLVSLSTILLYALIILFIALILISAMSLKVNNYITNFVGKVLLFGGFLTIVSAIILFLLIRSNFSSAFERFHTLFFEKGTYIFEPAKELLVKIYPEQLFMDLGLLISRNVLIISSIIIIIGLLLVFKSKSKKNI